MSDHGFYELAPEVVVAGVEEADQGGVHGQLLRQEASAVRTRAGGEDGVDTDRSSGTGQELLTYTEHKMRRILFL